MPLRSPASRSVLLAAVALAVTVVAAWHFVPGDAVRQDTPTPVGVDPTTTAGISAPAVADPQPLVPLKAGLDALASDDLAAARSARDRLPEGTLDRHLMAWAIATSNRREVGSAEIAAAANELRGWPGLDGLRRNGERAMLRENPRPEAVIEAFKDSPPETVEGARLLARAWVAQGDEKAAQAALADIWRNRRLDGASETAILREFGDLIPAEDHRARMERMLYIDRPETAARVAGRANAPELLKAWSAVIRGARDAGKLLDAVPQTQRGAG